MASDAEVQLWQMIRNLQMQITSLQANVAEQNGRIDKLENHARECCETHQSCELCI